MRKNFYNFIISISQNLILNHFNHRKFNSLREWEKSSTEISLDRKIEIIKCIFNRKENVKLRNYA